VERERAETALYLAVVVDDEQPATAGAARFLRPAARTGAGRLVFLCEEDGRRPRVCAAALSVITDASLTLAANLTVNRVPWPGSLWTASLAAQHLGHEVVHDVHAEAAAAGALAWW